MLESIYGLARGAVEQLLGVYIYRRRYLPPGVRLDEDLRRFLPHVRVRTAFDVGANVGQSAARYLEWFRDARVYCFEPVNETFAELSLHMSHCSRVSCHHVAVGARNGLIFILPGKTSDLAFIPTDEELVSAVGRAQKTEMVTLDAFCGHLGIREIDFLKIDTEGHDLAVLEGCERLLGDQRISVIKLEAGMTPANHRHVPFETLKAHLQLRDDLLFGIYEQVREWTAHSTYLRRVDPVFVSKRVVAEALAAPQ